MTKQAFPPLPGDQWPARDRSLWLAAQQPSGPLDDDAGFAAGWRPPTIKMCERGDGMLLGWLDRNGQLDPLTHPCDRITRELIKAFVTDTAPAARKRRLRAPFEASLTCSVPARRPTGWIG